MFSVPQEHWRHFILYLFSESEGEMWTQATIVLQIQKSSSKLFASVGVKNVFNNRLLPTFSQVILMMSSYGSCIQQQPLDTNHMPHRHPPAMALLLGVKHLQLFQPYLVLRYTVESFHLPLLSFYPDSPLNEQQFLDMVWLIQKQVWCLFLWKFSFHWCSQVLFWVADCHIMLLIHTKFEID